MLVVMTFQMNERPSPLKTFGQPGAVTVAIRHLGPALLGTTMMLVRIRRERSVPSLLDPVIGVSQPMCYCRSQRHTHGLRLEAGPGRQGLPSQAHTSVFGSVFAGEKAEGYGRALGRAPASSSDGALFHQHRRLSHYSSGHNLLVQQE